MSSNTGGFISSGDTLSASASTIDGLNALIMTADAETTSGTNVTISIDGVIDLNSDLKAINLNSGVTLTIEGTAPGAELNGEGDQRGFFVYAGDVTIQDLTLAATVASGGAGADEGGGGAGLGGGLFVASGGQVTLNDVTFTGDGATGGAGGTDPSNGAGNGGGGLGGDGGVYTGGGGGVGVGANGGAGLGFPQPSGVHSGDAGAAGIIYGAAGGGRGAHVRGGASGGGGGANYTTDGASGALGETTDGGGGVGGRSGGGTTGGGGGNGSAGGGGGFGGGGGGGSTYLLSLGFSTEKRGGNGGSGGFGGGGGGAGGGLNNTEESDGYRGGDGGFGGGGGGGASFGYGGWGAGNGGALGNGGSGGGGGGLGAGGDIFVQQGAALTIVGGTLGAGTVVAGTGGGSGADAGQSGQAYGTGIFLQGQQTVTLAAPAGQTLTISGVIADQAGSLPEASDTGDAGSIVIGSASETGTVELVAANTYVGTTTVEYGTLEIASGGSLASPASLVVAGGRLEIGAGGSLASETIDLVSAGATVQLDTTGTPLPNTITALADDTIVDLRAIPYNSGATISGTGEITVKSGGKSVTFTLGVDTAVRPTLVSDGEGGTEVILDHTSGSSGPDVTVVDSILGLNNAISAVNALSAGAVSQIIELAADIDPGTTGVATITLASGVSLTVESTPGHSYGLVGSGGGAEASGFAVVAGGVVFQNILLESLDTVGSAGSPGDTGGGGGGGGGLGGGLFVGSAASVTLNDVQFRADEAQGGNGAGTIATPKEGLLGQFGGNGGGFRGQPGGQGVGFEYISASKSLGFTGGEAAGFGEGGGGGFLSQAGGAGGFGGGGGAGQNEDAASAAAGLGGFGAGNGGIRTSSATGSSAGGGGLGGGGDIFIQAGGSLTIEGSATAITNGTVAGGSGGNPGQAFGPGIYAQGAGVTLTFDSSQGSETIAATITDDTAAAAAANYMAPTGYTEGSTGITVTGSDTVTLTAANTYTGLTSIAGGTLEIAAGASAGSGDIEFAGTDTTLQIDAKPANGSTFANLLGLFGGTDVLDLRGLAYVPGKTTATLAGGTLTVSDGATTEHFNTGFFAMPGAATSDGYGGTEIAAACYLAGTLILTDAGERPIETLAIGDRVITEAGAAEPIRWIGRRAFQRRFIASHPAILPVRFAAGSLGDGVPRRDLFVSPEHAMFLDGVLIPASALVNGSTIAPVHGMSCVAYWHVELSRHDVIWAEGAASETYLDTGSRGMFHNAHEYAALYPEAPPPGDFYAPRHWHGYVVHAVRKRLAALRAA